MNLAKAEVVFAPNLSQQKLTFILDLTRSTHLRSPDERE